MKKLMERFGLLAASVVLGLVVAATTGCGEELKCGVGTVDLNGTCDAVIQCDKGTRFENGKCVPVVTVKCGPGTHLVVDGEIAQCVAGEPPCGEGTHIKDGKCVAVAPPKKVECGHGTKEISDGNGTYSCWPIAAGTPCDGPQDQFIGTPCLAGFCYPNGCDVAGTLVCDSTLRYTCIPSKTPARECEEEGVMTDCYTGPAGTRGVGICHQGFKWCENGRWTECQLQVRPQSEACNGQDNNCDGFVDIHDQHDGETCIASVWYQDGHMVLTRGILVCNQSLGAPTSVGDMVCVAGGYVDEVCGNMVDDDGDGQVDETCQTTEIYPAFSLSADSISRVEMAGSRVQVIKFNITAFGGPVDMYKLEFLLVGTCSLGEFPGAYMFDFTTMTETDSRGWSELGRIHMYDLITVSAGQTHTQALAMDTTSCPGNSTVQAYLTRAWTRDGREVDALRGNLPVHGPVILIAAR